MLPTAVLCACVAVVVAFNLLALGPLLDAMQASAAERGVHGGISSLLLDAQPAFTPRQAHQTLQDLGPEGRHAYLVFEALDACAYVPAYTILFSAGLRALAAPAARRLPVGHAAALGGLCSGLPIAVGALDVAENACQAWLTLGFDGAAGGLDETWVRVAAVGGLVNGAKWIAFLSMLALLAGLGGWALVLRARRGQRSSAAKSE